MIYIKIKDIDKINEVEGELSEDYYYDENGKTVYTGEKVEFLQILALDSKSFERYVKKIGVEYEDVKKSGILCDDYKYYDSSAEKEKIIRRYKYSKDDIIKGIYNGSEINIKVCEVSNIRPYGLENNYYQGGYLIVNIDEYKNISFIPPIIISIIFVFVLVFIIMKYSINKINKQNAIETIRKENI